MSGVADLIERMEKAEGPDREIDARIAVAFGDVIMREDPERGFAFFKTSVKKGDWAFLSGCKDGEDDAYRALGQCLSTKHYTASLDAATVLVERVLPGWSWSLIYSRRGRGHEGVVIRSVPHTVWTSTRDGKTHGATPALALCLALLRALQQEDRR